VANEENLQPGNVNHKLTAEEAQRGGKRSGEVRREKRLFKDEIAKRLGAKDFEEIIDNLITRAKKEDKSFEVLRDTLGQKPKEEIEAKLTRSYEDYIKEVEEDNEY
jgi:hypothetical protein